MCKLLCLVTLMTVFASAADAQYMRRCPPGFHRNVRGVCVRTFIPPRRHYHPYVAPRG
jgi:plasmid stabilization system protein ParE